MPRKAQISRDIMLKHAFEMLVRDGYEKVNIKALAAEIGCSTQPIMWHFSNMQSFRDALLDYAIDYAKRSFLPWDGTLEALLEKTAMGYISIACNKPNLFHYLFIIHKQEIKDSELIGSMKVDHVENILDLLVEQKGLDKGGAIRFFMDYVIYVHGICSYRACGFCDYPEEEMVRMVKEVGRALLQREAKQP